MKITKTQLKQIVQETLTEVRLDTQGTTAGTVQKIGSGAVGVATVAASILGTPIAGGVVATGGAWLNNMANKFWSNRKLSDVKLTEKMLVMAADKILSAANEKGLDEQEIVKAISDDIKERLKNVPVDTVKMLRFEEYEIDKTSGSAGAKAAVKDALKDQGLFGKDTTMHKVKRGVDAITSPAASIKKLGDPTKYLSESGKKITKSQLKQIIKEEYENRKAGTYEPHMMVPKDHPKYSAEHQEMWDNLGKALAMIESSKAGIEALGLGNAGNPSGGGPFEPYTFYSKSQIEALEKIIILFEYGEII